MLLPSTRCHRINMIYPHLLHRPGLMLAEIVSRGVDRAKTRITLVGVKRLVVINPITTYHLIQPYIIGIGLASTAPIINNLVWIQETERLRFHAFIDFCHQIGYLITVGSSRVNLPQITARCIGYPTPNPQIVGEGRNSMIVRIHIRHC